MGNLNGQDSNSLLSKRLKKVTADRQAVSKKPEQTSAVVPKIERVLFAYRETLAYYQEMLEQFETEYEKNRQAMEQVSNTQLAALESLIQQMESRNQSPAQTPVEVTAAEPVVEAEHVLPEKLEDVQEVEEEEIEEEPMSLDAALQGIEDVKASLSVLAEEIEQVAVTINPGEVDETEENADSFLEKMEVYNKNLAEIKKRLDDLMRFVGKVDGSIIEALKSHTNSNKDALMEQLDELKYITLKKQRGIKPLVILNFLLGIVNVGGITLLVLELLGIISL